MMRIVSFSEVCLGQVVTNTARLAAMIGYLLEQGALFSVIQSYHIRYLVEDPKTMLLWF